MIELTESEYQELEAVMDKITGRLAKDRDGFKHEAERLTLELADARERLAVFQAFHTGEFWHHQGDENDHPESLTCPVLMSADDYREVLKFAKHGRKVLAGWDELCRKNEENKARAMDWLKANPLPSPERTAHDPGPDHIIVHKSRDRFEDHRHHAEAFSGLEGVWVRTFNPNGWSSVAEVFYRIPKGPLGDHRHWTARPPLPYENGIAWVWDGDMVYIVADASALPETDQDRSWLPYVAGDERPDPPSF